MRGIILIVAVAGLNLLGACSTLKGEKTEEYWSSGYGVKALSLDATSAARKLRDSIEKNDKNPVGVVATKCFNVPVGGENETECRQQRNAALATLMVASDDLCQDHLRTIYGNEAYYNILTGTVATLFSGAAAIAGSAAAKSSLAAISTFANAERSLLNETVYKSMLVTATSKKIRETRDLKAAALLPGSFKKPIDEYPMVMAVRDVVDYHYSCSFMLGLEKALEEGTQAGADGKRAKLEQEKLSLERYVDGRKAALTGAKRDAEITSDKGITGANARIEAIETQLLNLVNSQAPTTGSGGKAADSAPPDPATQKPKP